MLCEYSPCLCRGVARTPVVRCGERFFVAEPLSHATAAATEPRALHAHAYARTHTSTHTHTHIHPYTYTLWDEFFCCRVSFSRIRCCRALCFAYIHTHIYIYEYVYIYIYTHVYIHIYTYECICIYVHTYINMFTCI